MPLKKKKKKKKKKKLNHGLGDQGSIPGRVKKKKKKKNTWFCLA